MEEEEVSAMVVQECGVKQGGDCSDWGGLPAISKVTMVRGQKRGFLHWGICRVCTCRNQQIFCLLSNIVLEEYSTVDLLSTSSLWRFPGVILLFPLPSLSLPLLQLLPSIVWIVLAVQACCLHCHSVQNSSGKLWKQKRKLKSHSVVDSQEVKALHDESQTEVDKPVRKLARQM